MPYFRADLPTDRLLLPSGEGYWVLMKRHASYGDKAAAQDAMMRVSNLDATQLDRRQAEQAVIDKNSGRAMVTEFETEAYFLTLLSRLIVEWNLDDEDGRIRPVTAESLRLLEGEDGDFLQAEAVERSRGRPKDQQGPSRKPSSASSPLGADSQKIARLPQR